ncbi:MAG: phosphoribosylanthranilate isomerase [Parasphingorhabdus sp.]|jgi:phosphoribosylanthranilate isomerase
MNGHNLRRHRIRLKVCCIASIEEAHLAIQCGADAIGLVGHMPSGPGIITDEIARDIAMQTPEQIATFLLSSETDAGNIADHVRYVGATNIQIVQHIDPLESQKLAALIPDIQRVQVIHVEGPQALALIPKYQPYINAFLLDSGKPSESIPELGGTGRTHDWEVSRQFVSKSQLPVFLAGGLNPANISDAVWAVQPHGIDVCSGLRTNHQLDESKLRPFVACIRDH